MNTRAKELIEQIEKELAELKTVLSGAAPIVNFPDKFNCAVQSVSVVFGISAARLISRDRTQSVSEARWVLMRILKANFGKNLSEIGRILNIDHGTVIHGLNRAAEEESVSELYKAQSFEAFRLFQSSQADPIPAIAHSQKL